MVKNVSDQGNVFSAKLPSNLSIERKISLCQGVRKEEFFQEEEIILVFVCLFVFTFHCIEV